MRIDLVQELARQIMEEMADDMELREVPYTALHLNEQESQYIWECPDFEAEWIRYR